MKILKNLSLFTFFLFLYYLADSQNLNVKRFYNHFDNSDLASKKIHTDWHKTSTFAPLFWGYKIFFSSQDGAHCVFTPSCSEYAMQSLAQRGFFIGFLATFDRLARCNNWGQKLYPIDNKLNRYYDPVR